MSGLFDTPIESLRRETIMTGVEQSHLSDVSRVDYRPYSLEVFGSMDTVPRLRGMRIDGEPRVLFSREDISHALLDQPCWKIHGYTPTSARRILRNILLYASES